MLKYLRRSDYRFYFSIVVNLLLAMEYSMAFFPNPRHTHREAIVFSLRGMSLVLSLSLFAASFCVYAMLLIPLYGLVITLILVNRQVMINQLSM